MKRTNRSDLEELRAALERFAGSIFPGQVFEVEATSSNRSCATVRVFANSEDGEAVCWFQLFLRNPKFPEGVVRRMIDGLKNEEACRHDHGG